MSWQTRITACALNEHGSQGLAARRRGWVRLCAVRGPLPLWLSKPHAGLLAHGANFKLSAGGCLEGTQNA